MSQAGTSGNGQASWISVAAARDAKHIGSKIEVRGWVRTRRDSKGDSASSKSTTAVAWPTCK